MTQSDPENEAEIQQAISRLVQGRTVIVIAHRLKTVTGADTILVLDQGRTVGISAARNLREAKNEWAGDLTEGVLRKVIEENSPASVVQGLQRGRSKIKELTSLISHISQFILTILTKRVDKNG